MFLSNRRQLLAAIVALVAVTEIQPIRSLESDIQINGSDQSRYEVDLVRPRDLKSEKKSKESKSKTEKSHKQQKSEKERKKTEAELKPEAERKPEEDEAETEDYSPEEKVAKNDEKEKKEKPVDDEVKTLNMKDEIPSARIFEQQKKDEVTSRIFEDVQYQKDSDGRDRVASTPGSRSSIVRENSNTFDSIPTAPPVTAPANSSSGVNRGSNSLAGGTPSPTPANRNPQNNPAMNQSASRPGSGYSLNPNDPTPAPVRQFNNPGSLPISSVPRPDPSGTTSVTGGSLRPPTIRPTYRVYPTSPP
eukprot:CAMPEP_0172397640 /NCGR_PEP_ID=MMETSP1061-20121228/31879_1 /TAXON_ID=37318 /ORGANISM="Pseudo-nitzschia pungens, Strain cf. pungens" /LENGTH=303 /DNA_ID=CAMNT_0013129889 /DNA_START=112 /DNA_END=1019 /DNA_ORIENTATION=-